MIVINVWHVGFGAFFPLIQHGIELVCVNLNC